MSQAQESISEIPSITGIHHVTRLSRAIFYSGHQKQSISTLSLIMHMSFQPKNVTKYIGAAALLVSICGAASEAQALSITTAAGQTFEVEAVDLGSLYFSDLLAFQDILEDQVWWGDESLATEVSTLVADSLGFPNRGIALPQQCEARDSSCTDLFDATSSITQLLENSDENFVVDNAFTEVFYTPIVAFGDLKAGELIFSDGNSSSNNFNNILTEDSESPSLFFLLETEPTAVPTPAAILPSLFGLSLSAMRKRSTESSEE